MKSFVGWKSLSWPVDWLRLSNLHLPFTSGSSPPWRKEAAEDTLPAGTAVADTPRSPPAAPTARRAQALAPPPPPRAPQPRMMPNPPARKPPPLLLTPPLTPRHWSNVTGSLCQHGTTLNNVCESLVLVSAPLEEGRGFCFSRTAFVWENKEDKLLYGLFLSFAKKKNKKQKRPFVFTRQGMDESEVWSLSATAMDGLAMSSFFFLFFFKAPFRSAEPQFWWLKRYLVPRSDLKFLRF